MMPGILPTRLARKKSRKRIPVAPTKKLISVNGATGKTRSVSTVRKPLRPAGWISRPSRARQGSDRLAAERTADTVAHRGAGEPAEQAINIAQDRPEGENRRDIENRYGKENETAQQISADDEIKRRRVIPHGLLPSDNRFEIDPIIQRRPFPQCWKREERQEYN